MQDEDTMERVDIGAREQTANIEGIKFAIEIFNKLSVYCERCGMEAEYGCKANHPKKCFIYLEDFNKCLRSLEEWTK